MTTDAPTADGLAALADIIWPAVAVTWPQILALVLAAACIHAGWRRGERPW